MERGPCAIFLLGIGILSFRNVGDGRGTGTAQPQLLCQGLPKGEAKTIPDLWHPVMH